MNGEERRKLIMDSLAQAKQPVSASRFAKRFAVSRQIIVGDIALLRASGHEIIATARGYLLEPKTNGKEATIALCHTPEEVMDELSIFVNHRVDVINVMVDHALYGEIQSPFEITSLEDARAFVEKYEQSKEKLLSNLTNGVHLHTVRYQDEQDLLAAKQALAARGFLFSENEDSN